MRLNSENTARIAWLRRVTALILLITATAVFSQGDNIGEDAAEPAVVDPDTGRISDRILYNPVSHYDIRFEVKNVNFVRRHAPNGRGEFLDVVFDINNHTGEDLDLILWVVASYQENAIDERTRLYIPHPQWRTADPDKDRMLLHRIAVSPVQIDADQLWDEDDPIYIEESRIRQRLASQAAAEGPPPPLHPPLRRYYDYIFSNPLDGLPIKVRGDTGPGQHETLESNYIPPTPEERKRRVHRTLDQHTYTVQHRSRSSTVRTHHFSEYGTNFVFFNNVAIFVFDAARAEELDEQLERELGDGEELVNAMSFMRMFEFERPLRIY